MQAIIVSEIVNTIEMTKHNRVYTLSETATNEYINIILNPITRSIMECRHIIADPSTREACERYESRKFGRPMKGLKRGIEGTENMRLIQTREVPHDKTVT